MYNQAGKVHLILLSRYRQTVKGQQTLRFLVCARVASDLRFSIFIFILFHFAMKRCPIAANELLDRLRFCRAVFKHLFFLHRGMNVCPICAASLSHHTLVYGKFGLVPLTVYTC